ncbi:hypothetical protein O9G_005777 [Rozella allomycis CSF55]|uniref:Uncharacterized protein n=1 Tax=Rozella allomycis (strain CSF55) TaxID=988480 RepID=A0A075AYH1_ROZAC|nr:hypothetical protein O9G_005777 [Rozella allomycis CSF55]|eukprot:EPZ33767.1 hypothetical protein O9G_005777 [Rozella allomycis CSF55]
MKSLMGPNNGAKYLGVIGREKEFKAINKAVDNNMTAPKYSPMIITGSRGVGKTFLLKKVGMQDNPDLANEMLKRSKAFADVERVLTHKGKQRKFNEWIEKFRNSSVENVAAEYIRLTNIAFGVEYDNSEAPLVILLDEMQYWGTKIKVHSKFDGQHHTILSYLLTKLSLCRPVCICAGTHDCNIFKITEKSKIAPDPINIQVFSEEECKVYWRKMAEHWMKEKKKEIEYSVDDADVLALIYASYRIPRILYLATLEWFYGKCDRSETGIVFQSFEQAARKYYPEMSNFLISNDFSVAEIVQVILHCSVSKELDLDAMVPGSNRWKWKDLVHKSIIFPATNAGTYLLPFTYIWNNANFNISKIALLDLRKEEIRNLVNQLIPGLVLEDLFFDFQEYYNADPQKIGHIFESLVVSSAAVKIHLSNDKTLFEVFGCEEAVLDNLSTEKINGIERPTTEVFVDDCPDNKITHNIHATTAHHDVVFKALHTDERGHKRQVRVACSIKNSLAIPLEKSVVSQMKISKQSQEEVDLLLWIFLKDNDRPVLESNAVVSSYISNGRLLFINPGKCCNAMALDLISLSKKINSKKRPLE